MSLSSYDNRLPGSTSGCDDRFRFRSDVSRTARFFQPTDDEEEEEAEYEDIVVQLPALSTPLPPQRQLFSFPV